MIKNLVKKISVKLLEIKLTKMSTKFDNEVYTNQVDE